MLKTKDIVFICDDNYCLPTAVCIRSIIDNWKCSSDSIIIHVCTFGLSSDNIQLLQGLSTDMVHVIVDIFDLNIYKERIEQVTQKSHVTPTALIKFELANYFYYLDSLLYLDSDMVAKGDLIELMCIDLGDSYIGASYEFYNHINRISYSLKRSVSKDFYFNSGMMLLNLDAMRRDLIPDELWYYKLNKAKTTLMDQESLNGVCSSKSIQLPIKWNFNPLFLKKSYISEINKVYKTNYNDIEQLENDVRIIHYVGSTDKPWNYETAHMRNYWDKYYVEVFGKKKIKYRELVFTKRSYLDAIIDKIRVHGFYGFICNMFYLISERKKNA